MNESTAGAAPRKLWLRVLFMLLMVVAFQLAAWVLVAVALVQLVLRLVTDMPNDRLCAFGRDVGRYLAQIAHFVTFGTEQAPFPFSEWPSAQH